MEVILPIVFLLALAAAWTVLPLIPALREVRERRDVEPIRVVRDSETDAEHFAQGHRGFLREHLYEAMTRCRQTGQQQTGRLEDGTLYHVVPGGDEPVFGAGDTVVASCGDLVLPTRGEYRLEVYAARSVRGGAASVYRAVLAERSVELGAGSTTLRWVHADEVVRVGEGSRLWGRVSAGEGIELADDCEFERLHAPRIAFGPAAPAEVPAAETRPLDSGEIPDVVDVTAGRWLVRRRLELPAGARLEADLVVTGPARIGDGARILGSVKSHGDLELGRGVEVQGSVVSGRDVRIGEGCRVHGPVLAERNLFLGGGSVIGSPERLTTVSARGVRVAPGVVAHGTVWGHGEGRLGSDPEEARVGPVERSGRLEALRYRGCRGGFISRHRALLFSPADRGKIASAVALAAGSLALVLLARDAIARFWSVALDFLGSVLGVAQVARLVDYRLGPVEFRTPLVVVPSALPDPWLWWAGALLTAALVAVSVLLPRRFLPLAYSLRIVAFFQACSQLFFALWPGAFPYTGTGYVHTLLIAEEMLVALIPLVLAFTYYLFDFGVPRKIALTAIVLGHLLVMVPLQYAVQAFVLYHFSLLFLPLLFFVFGLPLNVLLFIALFSWGFSWRSLLQEQSVQWKARRRFV